MPYTDESTTTDGRAPTVTHHDRTGVLAGASVLGAVLASSCCIVPLALFSLGIGGAWIATLTALAPYKPIFVVIAGALILAGFISMRRRQRDACDLEGHCASAPGKRITTVVLWLSTLLVIAVIAWPYLLPLLMGD
ncbi:mercuric transporter MerT family protein [Arhodomonas sp. AD133]|uniref:mercuric transporter MerT family protein n=1 Tax=Arhodomonas sp. AD133 TaxID=3415009 RepID=UPI003EBDDEC3